MCVPWSVICQALKDLTFASDSTPFLIAELLYIRCYLPGSPCHGRHWWSSQQHCEKAWQCRVRTHYLPGAFSKTLEPNNPTPQAAMVELNEITCLVLVLSVLGLTIFMSWLVLTALKKRGWRTWIHHLPQAPWVSRKFSTIPSARILRSPPAVLLSVPCW